MRFYVTSPCQGAVLARKSIQAKCKVSLGRGSDSLEVAREALWSDYTLFLGLSSTVKAPDALVEAISGASISLGVRNRTTLFSYIDGPTSWLAGQMSLVISHGLQLSTQTRSSCIAAEDLFHTAMRHLWIQIANRAVLANFFPLNLDSDPASDVFEYPLRGS